MTERTELVASDFFVQRLKRLQALCSASGSRGAGTGVSALVFIPGPDGRHNKGSFSILKYLFQGSVGKDLYEGTLDETFECLEEIVLVVQESSVSIFLSQEAKKLIGPLLRSCPFLTEYLPTSDDEEDMDLFQQRKCEDFKRMILEDIPDGGVVGLPVPLGYDDVLDTESWALLQAFALDSVVCPTGFFTQRYAVVDISEDLDILYRTVDGCYVDKAVSVLEKNVETHSDQVMSVLRNANGSARKKLTVDEIVAPLDMLFDFGELDAAFPPDPSLRPRLFRGDEYSRADTHDPSYKWKERVVGDSSALVLEASEPSSGMRWARTLFLRRGKYFEDILDPEALVAASTLADDDEDADPSEESKSSGAINAAQAIGRMEGIYFKLWAALRWAVRVAFLTHEDVLDAGSEVQTLLQGIMTGAVPIDDSTLGDAFHGLNLCAAERLQVHMDCMDALGQVVKIEDVDDMGGLCWTYIRVSVYGIADSGGGRTTAVAIGDTFLFSPHFSKMAATPLSVPARVDLCLFPHIHDAFCLTHAVAQYRAMLGAGSEASSARRMISATKSIHMLAAIGLGTAIEASGAGSVSIVMLTDHPSCPIMNVDLRLFTGGLVVDRIEKDLMPLLFTFGTHVRCMWTVDIGDCSAEALRRVGYDESDIDDSAYTQGFVVVLALKNFDDNSAHLESVDACVHYNTTDRVLPSFFSCRHIALYVPSSSRHSSVLSAALRSWRDACRMHDVPDIRGLSNDEHPVPDGVLNPLLAAVDSSEYSSLASPQISEVLWTKLQPYPGHGYQQMREVFLHAEELRLNSADMNEEDAEQESKSSRALDDRPKYQGKRNNIVVVLGMPGSGLLSVAAQVHARVSAEYEKDSLKVLVLDINDANVEDNILHLSQSARSASRPVVIAIIDSALKRIPITAIYTRFSDNGCDICCCITVLSLPGDKNIWKRNGRTQFLGVETWSAATRNGLRAGRDFERNVVVFVESDQSGSKRRFHEELETFNPSATSVTVRPQFLWLDVEIMNTIFDACRSNVKQVRYPAVDVKDFPKSSQMPSSLRSLSSVDVVLAAGAVSYERVTILLTTLFPGAVISNTLAQHSSQLPANIKGLTGIQLGLMLAKIKVFSKRHHDLAMRDFQAVIDACDCDTLCALQASILSAHAILGRGVQSHVDGALFEATPDTLIARPLGESYHTTNTITLMGCFRPADVSVLRRLFEQCVIPPVQVRRHLEPVNVRSDTHKTAAQRMFGHLPVPSGWWYDGSSYVDMHGSRLSNRPDIDTLLDLYLIEKNKEVDMFNNMLHEVTPFIQNVD